MLKTTKFEKKLHSMKSILLKLIQKRCISKIHYTFINGKVNLYSELKEKICKKLNVDLQNLKEKQEFKN